MGERRPDYRHREVWVAEEAADYLECSLRHVQYLCNKGYLKSFRLGSRAIRITAKAVEEFMTSGEPKPKPKPRAAPRDPKPTTKIREIRRALGARPKSMQKRRFVYFIQAESGGPIKIGHAVDPLMRLVTLQAASPLRLMVLGCVAGDLTLERALHKEFAAERQHFEWFEPSARLIEFIAEALKTEGVSRAEIEKPGSTYRSRGALALRDRLTDG